MFKIGCILVAQLVILCGEIIIDYFKNPNAGTENFLVLESGNKEFVSAEGEEANSGEGDEDDESDESGGNLRH